jgi:hypothetical protein
MNEIHTLDCRIPKNTLGILPQTRRMMKILYTYITITLYQIFLAKKF